MVLKLGASAEIDLYKNADGDIVVQAVDKEALSDQGGQVALHPAAVSSALVKLFGGSTVAQQIVGFIVPALVGLLPSQP